MNGQDNLLSNRYKEIKRSLNLEYVDAIKILKENYHYSDTMIQDVFKIVYALQNQ